MLEMKSMLQLVLEAVNNGDRESMNKNEIRLRDDKIREVFPPKTSKSYLELEEKLKADPDMENQLVRW